MKKQVGSNAWNKSKRRKSLRAIGKKWCIVYRLVDPITGETRYIGQTRNTHSRIRYHLKDALSGKPGKLCDWIRSLHAAGTIPHLQVVEEPATWDVSEIIWIERYRQQGAPLLNILRGGQDGPFKRGERNPFRQRSPVS